MKCSLGNDFQRQGFHHLLSHFLSGSVVFHCSRSPPRVWIVFLKSERFFNIIILVCSSQTKMLTDRVSLLRDRTELLMSPITFSRLPQWDSSLDSQGLFSRKPKMKIFLCFIFFSRLSAATTTTTTTTTAATTSATTGWILHKNV